MAALGRPRGPGRSKYPPSHSYSLRFYSVLAVVSNLDLQQERPQVLVKVFQIIYREKKLILLRKDQAGESIYSPDQTFR